METGSPYSPPTEIGSHPSPAELGGKKIFWRRAIWVALTLFVIPPALTILAMIKAFTALGDHGIGDPSALAAAIGETIIALIASLIFSIPGLALLIISLVRFRSYRTKLRALPT